MAKTKRNTSGERVAVQKHSVYCVMGAGGITCLLSTVHYNSGSHHTKRPKSVAYCRMEIYGNFAFV